MTTCITLPSHLFLVGSSTHWNKIRMVSRLFMFIVIEKNDNSNWVEGSHISKIRWATCLRELSLETKVMNKTMSCLITLKMFRNRFCSFENAKNECCYKENWNYNDGIFISKNIFSDTFDKCWLILLLWKS